MLDWCDCDLQRGRALARIEEPPTDMTVEHVPISLWKACRVWPTGIFPPSLSRDVVAVVVMGCQLDLPVTGQGERAVITHGQQQASSGVAQLDCTHQVGSTALPTYLGA
jgi:hypothetical protein